MKIKVIACKVMMRELSEITATSPHSIDITWLKQGYHDYPDEMRKILQTSIDAIDEGTDPYSNGKGDGFDAIVLGYGLCSKGTCGVSSKKYPIILPRAHDCISLFLGSKTTYKELFDQMEGGAYWYNAGWIESAWVPCKANIDKKLEEFIELYGEDNAEFLLESEKGWYNDYKYVAYIKPHNEKYPDYSQFTKDAAKEFGWEYKEFEGKISLYEKMLSGDWDDTNFLVIPPNKTARQCYEGDYIVELDD